MKHSLLTLLSSTIAFGGLGCTGPVGVNLTTLLETDLTNTSSMRSYDYFVRFQENSAATPPGSNTSGWRVAQVFIPDDTFGVRVPLPLSAPFTHDINTGERTPTGEPENHYKLDNTFWNPNLNENDETALTTELSVYIGPLLIPEEYAQYRALFGINSMSLYGLPTVGEITPLANPSCNWDEDANQNQYADMMDGCKKEDIGCFRLFHKGKDVDTADYLVPSNARADLLDEYCIDIISGDDDDSSM
jgi:hypothetical protein